MHEATFERLTPNQDQTNAIINMRMAFGTLLADVMKHVPEGPDRTYIVRQLRTCAMWSNMAITHNADGSPRT